MNKLVTLDKNYEIKLKSNILEFIAPDLVFLPIKNPRLNIKLNQNLFKEAKIEENVYSPVSGNVKGLKECILSDGKKEKCLILENNFEEKNIKPISSVKKITNLEKGEFISKIENQNLKSKFRGEFSEVIISGIDDEPYVSNESFIQKKYSKEILELLEAIRVIFGVKVTLAIKNTDTEVISSYSNFWGTYDEIDLKLVDDLYLIGKEQFLIKNLNVNNKYLFLTISDIYNLWINIKKNHKITEKIITLSGDSLINPQVILVKLGTSLSWIVGNCCEFNDENYDVYINGLMQGIKINDVKNYIVDENLESLIFMKKNKIKTKNCISCGACIDICPINSNPVDAYKKHKKIKCINCGLCTYICPSYINLRKYIMGENNE